MSATSNRTPSPEGPGSVSQAPNLPVGFAGTFTSRFVQTGDLRQHAVIGGEGPPLLLIHGWPQNWYAWRLVMPALAQDYQVIAVDQRGIGLTDKPDSGYDTRTLANDLVALMDVLGHDRFAVVGHDTGYAIGYALAADHRDRVARVALLEIPGPPGVGGSPPLFVPAALNNRLWHIPFNRVDHELTELLVHGREEAFYGYEFAIQGGGKSLPQDALAYYYDLFRDSGALRASFGLYRAWDDILAQNAERAKQPLTIPVLGIGGAESWGEAPGLAMKAAANDVQAVAIPDAGHWLAEQAPDQLVAALTAFFAPYRAEAAALSTH